MINARDLTVEEQLEIAIAERDVARRQRAELAQALSDHESTINQLRAELEAAHSKNDMLVNKYLGR